MKRERVLRSDWLAGMNRPIRAPYALSFNVKQTRNKSTDDLQYNDYYQIHVLSIIYRFNISDNKRQNASQINSSSLIVFSDKIIINV